MSCRPTRYHVDDGRDVGTRTHAWHDEKKAELQRKERELKRAQKQQVGFRPIRSSSLVHSYKQTAPGSHNTAEHGCAAVYKRRSGEVSVRTFAAVFFPQQ
jgi:hypothetical protein